MADEENNSTTSSPESRSTSPNPSGTLQVPQNQATQASGKTRSSSPSTTPAPLIIKAHSQACRFQTLQDLRSEVPEDLESTTSNEVQSLLDSVEELHTAFLTEHAHIEEFWPVKCMNHEYFASGLLTRETKLVAALRRSLRRLITHRVNSAQPSMSNATATTSTSRAAKLPKLAIPKFAGNYVEWPAFSELFTSLIINDSRLMEIDRLYYLRASLTGEPSRRVNAFPLMGSSFQAYWEYLNKRFSNKRLLIKEQLDKLLTINPITTRSATALKDLAATFTEVNETLVALKADQDMHNCLMVHILTNSLDKVTREAWETSLSNSAECPRYQDLLAFVEKKGGALEQMESSTKKPSAPAASTTRSAQRKSTAHLATQNKPASQPSAKALSTRYPCDCCSEDYFIVSCPKFREKSSNERRKFIVTNTLCKNCCGRHKTEVCKSAHRCKTCGAKHHTMLHPSQLTSAQNSSQLQPNPKAEASTAPPTPQTEGKKTEGDDVF